MGQPTVPFAGEVGGGGGGVSTVYSRPWYQVGDGVPGGTQRLVPDIAAFSDVFPGYLIHLAGNWEFIGGTSAATPLTAGAFALQSSAARAQGRPALGFVNPLLYSLASTSPGDSTHPLFDITIGTNDVWDIGVYPATPGFDLATGLGSVMHGALERELFPPSRPVVVPVFTG